MTHGRGCLSLQPSDRYILVLDPRLVAVANAFEEPFRDEADVVVQVSSKPGIIDISVPTRSLHVTESRKANLEWQSLRVTQNIGHLAYPSSLELEGSPVDVKSRQSIPRSLKASLEDQLVPRQHRQRSITQF